MPSRWTFFAFDWVRFRALEPTLRAAHETADFAGVQDAGAEETLETLEEDAEPEVVCNALLTTLCGAEEAVVFEAGLPEMIRWLRRQPDGDEAAEMLGDLVSAVPNIADWFRVEVGLVGLLTQAQTQALSAAFAAFRRRYRPPEPPRGLAAWTRRFASTDPAREMLDDLMNLVDEAAACSRGIAALREE